MNLDKITRVMKSLCDEAREEGYYVGYQKGLEDAQKQTDEIKIGDEVYYDKPGDAGVVTRIVHDNPIYFYGITSQGKAWCGGVKYKKTGRNFPQIVEVLEQMKNEGVAND